MLFTILIPVYNGSLTIRETLDSALSQEFRDFEVLVINDGSTDSTPEIVGEYCESYDNFRMITKENGGTASAYDLGTREAKGEFIVYGAADDLLLPNNLRVHAEAIHKQPDFTVFCTNGYFFNTEEGWRTVALKEKKWQKDHEVDLRSLTDSCILSPGCAFRARDGISVGGFSMGSLIEDYDLWLRFVLRGYRIWYSAQRTVMFRDSETQRSAAFMDMDVAKVQTLEKMLALDGISSADQAIICAGIDSFLATQQPAQDRQNMVDQRKRLYAKVNKLPAWLRPITRALVSVLKPLARPFRRLMAAKRSERQR